MGTATNRITSFSKVIISAAVTASLLIGVTAAVPFTAGASGTETYDMTMLSDAAPRDSRIQGAHDLAADLDGNLFLVERTGRIVKITESTSEVILELTSPPPEAHFTISFSITTDTAGNLFISERFGNQIQKLTPGGELTVIAGTGIAGSEMDQLDTPGEIDFDGAGNLYVHDRGNSRILRLAPDGAVDIVADLTTIPDDPSDGAFDDLWAMGVTPTGSVNFCDRYRKFEVIAGTIEEIVEPEGVDGCYQIDFDAAGNKFTVGLGLPLFLQTSAGVGPYDDPDNIMKINVRPDGVVDVLADGGTFTPYTLRAGEPREKVSQFLDIHFLRYDPIGIARNQAGKIQMRDYSLSPIRNLEADDSITVLATGEFDLNSLTVGSDASYSLNTYYSPVQQVGPGFNRIDQDGTVTRLWPAFGHTTGVYVAPDETVWATVWKTNPEHGNPTLVRYNNLGDPEILWSTDVGPASTVTAIGVAFDTDGTAFIGEDTGHRVWTLSTDGAFSVLTEEGGKPLDVDESGRILVLTNSKTLAWIETDGSMTSLSVTGGLPGDIADAVVDGQDIVMLVKDGETNRVARLTPTVVIPPTTTTSTTSTTSTTAPSTTTTAAPTTTTSTPPTDPERPAACTRAIHAVTPGNHFEGLSARLYIAYFLRQPDTGGYRYWADKLEEGVDANDISWGFANSAEFQIVYDGLDNDGFVDLVYHNVMCRTPDEAGAAYWLGLVNDGTISRSGMMLQFAVSPEFHILTGT